MVALVAVGLGLVTSLRRRRRDLALLKTLGFPRGQLRTAVAWQASTVGAVGLLVGIPLGLLVGGFIWRRVADELGVSSEPTWPVLTVLLLIPATLIAVNVVAAVPSTPCCPHTPPSSYDRSDVVTSLDDVKPLELREHPRRQYASAHRGGTATASVVLATIALVVAVIAALVGDRVPLGPGRVLRLVLVGSWALAAVFVAVHRPREALAEIMALAATIGTLVSSAGGIGRA